MPQLKVYLSIGYLGASQEGIIEVDDDEWAVCETQEEKENLLEGYCQDWANNLIGVESTVIKEEKN